MSYAAGGVALGGVIAGPAGAMIGGIVGKRICSASENIDIFRKGRKKQIQKHQLKVQLLKVRTCS